MISRMSRGQSNHHTSFQFPGKLEGTNVLSYLGGCQESHRGARQIPGITGPGVGMGVGVSSR